MVDLVIADVVIVVVLRVFAAIAIAIITTVVSLRFLGIRRGWGTALLAGLIGWGGAAILALALNSWDWGADGLAIHVFAIAVPATMAAAVALDLLARPGSLAIGERAGLVTTPRPFRAIRRRIEVLRRYRELVRLAQREGFGPGSRSEASSAEEGPQALGIRLRRVLEEAGIHRSGARNGARGRRRHRVRRVRLGTAWCGVHRPDVPRAIALR